MTNTCKIWQDHSRWHLIRDGSSITPPAGAVFIGEFQAESIELAFETVGTWCAAGMPAIWPKDSRNMGSTPNIGKCGKCHEELYETEYYWCWRLNWFRKRIRVAVCSIKCRTELGRG